jgi:hypothetical protein
MRQRGSAFSTPTVVPGKSLNLLPLDLAIAEEK